MNAVNVRGSSKSANAADSAEMTPYRFTPSAFRELTQATLYYEQRENGLGLTFLDEVEAPLERALPEKSLFELLLRVLCVLCVSVVQYCSGKNNHRDTENTEVFIQRLLFRQSRLNAFF